MASRRRGTETSSDTDYIADLIAMGELGKEDGEVLKLVMQHVCSQTGLHIVETDYSREPRPGEYVHLARKDVSAPPGRLQLRLASLEAVRQVKAALHGQTVQVGTDLIGFRIANDRLDAEGIPGGVRRPPL